MQSLNALQNSFLSYLPTITDIARSAFRRLNPEALAESIQNVVSLAWKAFLQLNEQERAGDVSILKSVVFYAIRQTRDGRTICGCLAAKDAADQRGRRTAFEQFELRDFEGKRTSVPDAVSFRHDVPLLLAQLSSSQRAVVEDLMAGHRTSEVAERQGLSAARVSQVRQEFKVKYEALLA